MGARILYIDHAPYEGGAEVSLRELIEALLPLTTFQFILMAPENAPYAGKIREETGSAGERFVHWPLTFHWRSYSLVLPLLFDLLSLARQIQRINPDIIHANTRVANILAGILYRLQLLPSGARLVNHVRDKDPLPGWKFKFIGAADQLIANSYRVKDFLVKGGVPEEKIEVIYNGVDLSRFNPAKIESKTRPRRRHDLVITTVGQIYPRKGFKYLINAMREVVKKFPKVQLQIVGEDPTKDQRNRRMLKRRVEQLGLGEKVSFLGYRRDIPKILAQTDVFVLPSLEEPFGRVIVEAMAMELPVVATRVGGIPEIVVAGETGFLVEPGDSNALSQKIIQLLQDADLRMKMGKRGRERVEENFSLQQHLHQMRAVYAKLMNV